MNETTKQFLDDESFNELYNKLYETHKPIKANVPNDNLESIGLIIVKFQRLESTIRSFIGMLANISNDQKLVNIFTVKSSFKNLITMLSALAIEREFHKQDDLNSLLSKCNKAEDIRNQIVHSVWTSGPRFKTTMNNKKGIVHQSEKYESDELKNIAMTIDKLDTSIDALKFDWIIYCKDQGNIPNGVKFIG